jgi:hypothetical protein
LADKRAFAKFDVGYLDNPKMADVLDSSLHAICMHFASVLHCSQHLTDGLVAPKAMQRKVGASDADTRILIDAGLWHGPEHQCEACWEACPDIPENRVYVHDFLEHNRDAAEAKRVSKKRSDAAKARWNGDANSNANRMQSALQNEPVCNAEREREKEREKEAKASSSEPSRPDVEQVISSFSQLLEANDVKHKPGKSWHDAARLLIDKDGYTPEQIIFVARFATTDEFWMSNVLSLPKLREKFEALKIKAQAKNQPPPQRMDHSDRARAKEADMLARFHASQEPFLEIEA